MNLQVLREIDKIDRLGLQTVQENLVNVAGVHPIQAIAIIRLFDGTFGDGLDSIEKWHATIGTRFDLMAMLESTPTENGYTAWDELLDMKQNQDQTWSDGGRPQNIGWALDDLVKMLKETFNPSSSNGRTPDFDSGNGGSNPPEGTTPSEV